MARIIALHDIAGDNVTTKCTPIPVEVPRLWRELKAGANVVVHEFVSDPQRLV